MNQMEQQEREQERLQNAGVRIEIIEDFEKTIDHIFEKTWCEITAYIDDSMKKHHLSDVEMVLMCMIMSEIIQVKYIQSLEKMKTAI